MIVAGRADSPHGLLPHVWSSESTPRRQVAVVVVALGATMIAGCTTLFEIHRFFAFNPAATPPLRRADRRRVSCSVAGPDREPAVAVRGSRARAACAPPPGGRGGVPDFAALSGLARVSSEVLRGADESSRRRDRRRAAGTTGLIDSDGTFRSGSFVESGKALALEKRMETEGSMRRLQQCVPVIRRMALVEISPEDGVRIAIRTVGSSRVGVIDPRSRCDLRTGVVAEEEQDENRWPPNLARKSATAGPKSVALAVTPAGGIGGDGFGRGWTGNQ